MQTLLDPQWLAHLDPSEAVVKSEISDWASISNFVSSCVILEIIDANAASTSHHNAAPLLSLESRWKVGLGRTRKVRDRGVWTQTAWEEAWEQFFQPSFPNLLASLSDSSPPTPRSNIVTISYPSGRRVVSWNLRALTPWPQIRCPSHLFVAPKFFHRYAGLWDVHRPFGFYVARGLATLVYGEDNEFCRYTSSWLYCFELLDINSGHVINLQLKDL